MTESTATTTSDQPPLAVAFDSAMTEAGGFSEGAFEVVRDYWQAIFGARGVGDIYAANMALMTDSFGLAARAASLRQAFHGVVTPTLNDA